MPTQLETAKRDVLKAVITALVIFGLYVFIATHASLWDRDEPRFSQATVEMITHGNWLYPTFEGRLRPDKPILIYWLMAGPVLLLGPTELAFRLPSCLGAAGACLCTFFAARRLGAGRWAWWAMVILATTLMPTILGTFATADGVLLFFLTAAMTVFTYAFTAPVVQPMHIIAAGLLLGGAWLTKGPLGLFPVLSLALAAWWYRWKSGRVAQWPGAMNISNFEFRISNLSNQAEYEGSVIPRSGQVTNKPLSPRERVASDGEPGEGGLTGNQATNHLGTNLPRLRWLILFSTLISLLVFLAWAIPANFATGNEFAKQGIGRHVIQRVLEPAEGHGGRNFLQYLLLLPFYLPMIIAGFFPWTLHLPGSVHALLGGRLGDLRTRALLWGWLLPLLILMSLFATKLPHYVMPLWPALAIMCALMLQHAHNNPMPEWDHRWLRGGVWFFAPIALGLGLLLTLGPWWAPRFDPVLEPLTTIRWAGLFTGLWVLGWSFMVIRLQLREKWLAATKLTLVGIVGTLLLLWGWLIPQAEPIIKLSPPIAQAIRANSADDVPVVVYGYYEPSLTLYVGRGRLEKLADDAAVVQWARGTGDIAKVSQGAGVLVITDEKLARIETTFGVLPLRELARVKGINHNEHGQALILLAMLREPAHP